MTFSTEESSITELDVLSTLVVVRLQHFQTKNPQNFRCEGCETLVYFYALLCSTTLRRCP